MEARGSALPTRPEEFGAAWLTAALAPRFPGVVVQGLDWEPLRVGTNCNARLKPRYTEPAGAPASLFVKLPPQDETQRLLVKGTGMAAREVDFYRHLAAVVPLRAPEPYYAASDPATGDFVILIEDLAEGGCRFLEGGTGVSLDFARQAMQDLAALHAAFAGGSGRSEALAWVQPPVRMPEYGAGMLSVGLASRREEMSPAFAELAELYVELNDPIHDAWERGEPCLLHGDTHLANLFDDAGRPGFLDWGLISWGPGMRDVTYFLCMSLSVEDRRGHERSLIEAYLAALAEAGAAAPSFDEAWALHRLHASYTVPAAAPAVLREPPELASYLRDFLERANAAVTDLEAVPALRAAIGG